MISATEALLLPTAQLTDEERKAADALEAHFAETGTAPKLEAILEQVESYYETLLDGALTTQKIRKKLNPVAPKPAAPAPASQPGQTGPRTIPNSLAAVPPQVNGTSKRLPSRAELLEAAKAQYSAALKRG